MEDPSNKDLSDADPSAGVISILSILYHRESFNAPGVRRMHMIDLTLDAFEA